MSWAVSAAECDRLARWYARIAEDYKVAASHYRAPRSGARTQLLQAADAAGERSKKLAARSRTLSGR